MEDPLDNPVWHALTGPHAAVALGAGAARHYPREAAPFSAISVATPAAYADLAHELPPGLEARLFRRAKEAPPPGWAVLSARPIRQMVADSASLAAPHPAEEHLVALGLNDAADMLALAEVAKPGPFGPRTGELGRFVGWRASDGRLLAIAGERFRTPDHVELSAICVHPDIRGRGLGAALTLRLARDALARGEAPFLHVFPDNPAVGLYARLGFRERATLSILWHRRAS
ncbi:GNAT family N-acetyltransferase [Roseomonas harenae]|uniref:GNAT family N-acetyltransferase n=1 Tax=Muricoccus harenae TaxID=2692566 RepID=UPI001331310A|nr:GNAT family N-acetyltransferase [Roseomonas harenae]